MKEVELILIYKSKIVLMEDDNFLKFNVENCDGINDVAILLKDKGIIEDISFYLYGSELGNDKYFAFVDRLSTNGQTEYSTNSLRYVSDDVRDRILSHNILLSQLFNIDILSNVANMLLGKSLVSMSYKAIDKIMQDYENDELKDFKVYIYDPYIFELALTDHGFMIDDEDSYETYSKRFIHDDYSELDMWVTFHGAYDGLRFLQINFM